MQRQLEDILVRLHVDAREVGGYVLVSRFPA
jgi:hypothetical protein